MKDISFCNYCGNLIIADTCLSCDEDLRQIVRSKIRELGNKKGVKPRQPQPHPRQININIASLTISPEAVYKCL